MSITGDAVVTTPPSAQLPETTVIRSWKTPIALAIFSVLFGVLLLAAPRRARRPSISPPRPTRCSSRDPRARHADRVDHARRRSAADGGVRVLRPRVRARAAVDRGGVHHRGGRRVPHVGGGGRHRSCRGAARGSLALAVPLIFGARAVSSASARVSSTSRSRGCCSARSRRRPGLPHGAARRRPLAAAVAACSSRSCSPRSRSSTSSTR
jgi:hypothetical protein